MYNELTKLTDLPQLCLDKILLNLSITDLVNAANADDSLALSAVRVFSVNFKNKNIVFGFPKIPNSITDQTTFQSVLAHFGGKIQKLISRVENQFILNEIVDKCHLNLQEWYIDCQQEIINIDRQCPNLKKLSLIFSFNDSSFIDQIPNLETIEIVDWELSPIGDENPESIRNIACFVNNNKQISDLFISHESTAIVRLQQSINWDELNIEKLGIFTSFEPDLKTIRFGKNLRSLMLSAGSFDDIKSFDLFNIEELDIRSFSQPKHDGFLNFASNSNLKKLKIRFVIQSFYEVGKLTEFLQILGNNLIQIEELLINVWVSLNIRNSIEAEMFEAIRNIAHRTPSDALQMIKVEIDHHRDRPGEGSDVSVSRTRIGVWDSMIERKFITSFNEKIIISFDKRNI